MKRMLCMFLALTLILGLFSGCNTMPPPESTQTTAPCVLESTTSPETTVPPETEDPALEELRNNLPVMDGSTSLIPLEAGLRAALFGISMEEARKDVNHTSSWSSYYNLLNGTVDLVFSVPLSEDQIQMGESSGVAPIAVPIAKEGFVFVVNAENPVDTLTQAQLRDIYSGRITNWSQVGGLNEEIIPYQRNYDSGSQNYMLEFMGDIPLTDAPSELRPASMSGLMDVIAVNDNSRAAIGYSVYAYAADMYGNGNEIKFIKVDGVAPSKASFADGSYPLMGCNYAIYRAEDRRDTCVSRLVDWILSDAGQRAIANAGYVTIRDIGYDYTEASAEVYKGTGAGIPAGGDPTSEYAIQGTAYTDGGDPYSTDRIPPIVATLPDGTQTYRIDCLADKTLQQEINDWIDAQMLWAAEERPALEAQLQKLNAHSPEYPPYVFGLLWDYAQPENMDAACIITAKNGYLSVAVSLCYTYQVMAGYGRYHRTETATWDLIEGRRLAPEELFFDGVDIAGVLNPLIREKSQRRDGDFSDQPELLADFIQLPPGGWHLTHDAIYFDAGGPTFAQGFRFDLEDLPDGTLVSRQLRDFTHCFDSDTVSVFRQFRSFDRDLYYAYNADELVSCGFLKEEVNPHAASVNAQIMDYLNSHFTRETIEGYFTALGYDTAMLDLWMLDWYTLNWGGRYLIAQGYCPELYLEATNEFVPYPAKCVFLFDLTTGQEIGWQDLFLPGWEKEAVLYSSHDGTPIEQPDYDSLAVDSVSCYEGVVTFFFESASFLQIPTRFLRFE